MILNDVNIYVVVKVGLKSHGIGLDRVGSSLCHVLLPSDFDSIV